MKKIIYTLVILAGSLCMASCDDLLDVQPLSQMTPGDYFKSRTELQMFAQNLYTVFPSSSLYVENTDHETQKTLSDEMRGGDSRTVPASGSGWSWGDLRNANTILDYVGNCDDADAVKYYTAFAKFFRAYIYFEKVKRFGDVPWSDTQVDAHDEATLNRPRDSREFIMQKMIADIDAAIEGLPAEKNVYQITRWTALALKARFCLFEGTFRKYHADDVYLQTLPADAKPYTYYLNLAATAAKQLMDAKVYKLYEIGGEHSADSSYYRLFSVNNAVDVADEVILARNYSINYGVGHNAGNTMNAASMGAPGMTKKLVWSYLMKDGTRFQDKYPGTWETMQFLDEVKDRDPRLSQSIRTPGYHRIGETTVEGPNPDHSVTGYQPVKYVGERAQDTYNNGDNDLFIFRYAEVLLNYAEAKAELNDINQSDLDISVNLLRDRVGMPHLTTSVTVDPFLVDVSWGGYYNPILLADPQEALILEIRRERSIELFQEGHRYYDVIRWKEGKVFEKPFYGIYFPTYGSYNLGGATPVTIAAPTSSDDVGRLSGPTGGYLYPAKAIDINPETKRVWDEGRDYLYPVPSGERSLTHGIYTQNPGWKDGLNF